MSTEFDDYWGNVMPTEILLHIFAKLPAKSLMTCALVCTRWRMLVDSLTLDDELWRRHYDKDFSQLYKRTKLKSRPGLPWFNLYRSLSMWPKLKRAKEMSAELVSSSNNQNIRNFVILKNGMIGVHKRENIVYYDIRTLKESRRLRISGEYCKYAENDYAIVTENYHQLLVVRRKQLPRPHLKWSVKFHDVRAFLLVDNLVYYANMLNQIFVCNLNDDNMVSAFVKEVTENIICLGFLENIHVLTLKRKIYTIVDDNIVLSCRCKSESNLLHHINMFNLLECLDWRFYFQWIYILNHNVPMKALRDIVYIRSYGDVYFVGSNWGILRVYYAPYDKGELDLLNSEPVKQYNFMEKSDAAMLTMCPILQIDVLEEENGHIVIVAMPKKIVLLQLTHDFK